MMCGATVHLKNEGLSFTRIELSYFLKNAQFDDAIISNTTLLSIGSNLC